MSERPKTAVTVVIAGQEYTLRADAPPEYVRACAAFLDQAIAQVTPRDAHLDPTRAAILAALSITDQLFKTRAEIDALRRQIARLAADLASAIEASLAAGDLAPRP